YALLHLSLSLSFPTRRSSDLRASESDILPNSYKGPMPNTSSGILYVALFLTFAQFQPPVLAFQSASQKIFIEPRGKMPPVVETRSEEHTSELQSRFDLVCRLL